MPRRPRPTGIFVARMAPRSEKRADRSRSGTPSSRHTLNIQHMPNYWHIRVTITTAGSTGWASPADPWRLWLLVQAGVVVSDYTTLMVEILRYNARPEAAAVYASDAPDMPAAVAPPTMATNLRRFRRPVASWSSASSFSSFDAIAESPNAWMSRPREARSCRVTCVLPRPAHWATSHEPLVGSRRCPSRPGPHPGARTRSRRLVVSSPLPAVARFCRARPLTARASSSRSEERR